MGGSCKVLGIDKDAEGLETIEMESFQRKFVFYYLYDRNNHLEKNSRGQTMTSSKVSKRNLKVKRKTTLFHLYCEILKAFSFKTGSWTQPCTGEPSSAPARTP